MLGVEALSIKQVSHAQQERDDGVDEVDGQRGFEVIVGELSFLDPGWRCLLRNSMREEARVSARA